MNKLTNGLMSMKWKRKLGNMTLVLASSAAALFLCELSSRLVLDPVDYLSPTLVRDDVLGIRLPEGSGGHDRWGFRNQKLPETAEVVAVGDSHTYGNCAKMDEAWPKVLGRLTNQDVYSLGMGGYGPNQYYHLLKTKALGLKPSTIVCGLYMGDDFDNAYRITYGLNHWASLRHGGMENVDPDIWKKETVANPSLQKQFRIWLSEHSVLYRLVVHGMLANLKGRYQVENASRIYASATSLILPKENIQEAFLPQGVLRGLNQEEASVREGMRLTFTLLKQMSEICVNNHIQFLVAVIPTKETVYSRYLEHNSKLAMSDILDKLIANERVARYELFRMFNQEKISFVDLLPAMEKATEKERIYTYGVTDMHPNKNGYRVIAEAISQSLTRTK